jgi:hypothetical protein
VNAIIFIVIGILREDPLSTVMLDVFYVLIVILLYEALGAKTREHVVPLSNKQEKTSSLVYQTRENFFPCL